MAQRFELQRALTMPQVRGVDRIVRSLFVSAEPPVAGAVVVNLLDERGAATRTPRTSP